MKKILLTIILLFPISAYALSLPDGLYSDKVLVYDLTDDLVLLEKKSEEVASIASLTKIMTAITAIEKNQDINKRVEITDAVFAGLPWDASLAGLKVGDILTIEDLLHASILPSGADATQALAISTSGSVTSFVSDMNSLAKDIGATNSTFKNVTGLDEEGHQSTARDILKILKYALNNPLFRRIYSTKEYTLTNEKVVRSTVVGYSKNLNLNTDRILGSKTGYTSKAGLCISALININGHEVIIITLGASPIIKEAYNVKDALTLISFLDNNYKETELIKERDLIKEIPVILSKTDSYNITSSITITKYLPTDYNKDNFKVVYDGLEELSFNTKGKIGSIKYYYSDVLLNEEDVYLNEKIKPDVIKILKEYWYIFSLFIFGLLLLFYLSLKLKKRVVKH
ncbi:MAG: hypothetical protein OSJ65_04890 [Bacilli bacterium]|nr:hypothetical protein [Bacilli bacterium]